MRRTRLALFTALSLIFTPLAAQDFQKGLAAEQGDASAQNNLGIVYYNGQGVLEDFAEAVKWFRLAADQGVASAQFSLGNNYHYGQGGLKLNLCIL